MYVYYVNISFKLQEYKFKVYIFNNNMIYHIINN
jgi:hypothetical protein